MFAGKLCELGHPLPPLSGTMALPAAFPSWIPRLNPALVRCRGPDAHFGLVYQEKPGGTRLPGGTRSGGGGPIGVILAVYIAVAAAEGIEHLCGGWHVCSDP